jgi:glucose/arabinose dehydrogenase
VVVLVAMAAAALVLRWQAEQIPAIAAEHGAPPEAKQVVRLELIAKLDMPVFLASPPGDAERLFVVEKAGRVRIIKGGETLQRPFLDVSDGIAEWTEQGLLGLAFHPAYADNGRFVVNFTDTDGDTHVVELRASADDPDVADPSTARELLYVEQPFKNHNGGHVCFGPDGMLYVGLGDGGWRGDPQDNGQDPRTLLGAMVRIDVDGGADGRPYGIPEGNPWASGEGGLPEVFAIGLRNPWRYAFDRETGDLYIADVGQDKWEEVHVSPAGAQAGVNYGWRQYEGTHRYARMGRKRDIPRIEAPVMEYNHRVGCSITGGYVYRGSELPELRGHYFYADYCTGVIRSFRWEQGGAKDTWDWTTAINSDPRVSGWASFGEDAGGELYILSLDGRIFRFTRRADAGPPPSAGGRSGGGDAPRTGRF